MAVVGPRFASSFTSTSRLDSGLTLNFARSFGSSFGSNLSSSFWTTLAPLWTLATSTTAASPSAKVARTTGSVTNSIARGVGRCRRRLFPFTLRPGKLSIAIRWNTSLQPVARTRLCRTIRRNGFVQVFILLFEIHEIGNVQEGVAFESNVDKCRLHARQHACHSAFIDRAG